MAGASTTLSLALPPTDLRLEWLSFGPVRTGMQHLCRAGLSENWLLKACGDRHWIALAAAYRLDVPDFRGGANERPYPAFVAVALDAHGDARDGGLGSVGEHLSLDFSLTLERQGRTRFRSRIEVVADGRPIATVSMTLVFVHRAIPGSNRSAKRGMVARPCRLLPLPRHDTAPFCAEAWETHIGFARTDRQELARLVLDPSPHEDFNGAEFLYFSAFQAMLDRAEWAWFRQALPLLITRQRQIFYLGNAELGDRIVMILCGAKASGDGRDHWVEMQRESDSKTIAVAFTQKISALKA